MVAWTTSQYLTLEFGAGGGIRDVSLVLNPQELDWGGWLREKKQHKISTADTNTEGEEQAGEGMQGRDPGRIRKETGSGYNGLILNNTFLRFLSYTQVERSNDCCC